MQIQKAKYKHIGAFFIQFYVISKCETFFDDGMKKLVLEKFCFIGIMWGSNMFEA